MGALLNVSIFMEPLSNCTCCEARQIPIYQSKPFLKYIQMLIFSYQVLHSSYQGAFTNRLSKFQMAFTTESAPTEISFFAQIRNMLIFPKGRGVVAQCERRRPSKKDGRNLRIRTWNQTEPPGEPRHREVHESTRETAFGKKELFRGRLTNSRVGYSAQGGTAGVRARFV
jgi:hypothetical protein